MSSHIIENKPDCLICASSKNSFIFSDKVRLISGFVEMYDAFCIKSITPSVETITGRSLLSGDYIPLKKAFGGGYAGKFAKAFYKDFYRTPIIVKDDKIKIFHVELSELGKVFDKKEEAQEVSNEYYREVYLKYLEQSRWYRFWNDVDDYADLMGMKRTCEWEPNKW